MGGGQSINYASPISDPTENQSAIYRYPKYKDQLVSVPEKGLDTIKKILINSGKTYKGKQCLGTIIRKQGQKDRIQYLKYDEVIDIAQNIGSAIFHKSLFSISQVDQKMKFIGIFSKNRVQWTITDIACALYGFATVPIYDTLGDENISYVLKQTQLTTCFVNDKGVSALIKTTDLANLKTLICYDEIPVDMIKKMEERGVLIINYKQLLKIGNQNKISCEDPKFDLKPQTCLTFCYTSGTTGPPKGAMLSHGNYASFCAAVKQNQQLKFSTNDIAISYLPLPHVLQRQFLYSLLCFGSRIVYFNGDVQKLKDDLALVKPTIFVSVPRLFNKFYDVIKKKLSQVTGWTKTGLDYALSVKIANANKNGGVTHKVYDKIFFSKTKLALGGNVRLMISGSAPLLPEVQKFLKAVICCPLIQGYGQTQSTGAATITAFYDPKCAQIGGPVSNTQYKLVDIPEMNYTHKDVDQNGNLTPRGQIWFRGPSVFLGYYKDQVKTKQTITQDGWLKTGDIAVILHENNALKIIDRKKNIFKLQQGQYVAPQKVENIYKQCDIFSEMILYGQSTQDFPIAIIEPVKFRIAKIAEELNIKGSHEQLCLNKQIKIYILNDMNVIGKKKGLNGFELAKNIYLQPSSFMQRGILNTTMKVVRHLVKNVYKDQIKQMYAEGMLPLNKEKK